MNTDDKRCGTCGTTMTQTGSFEGKVTYKCKGCGRQETVELSVEDNSVFWTKRAELLARTAKGLCCCFDSRINGYLRLIGTQGQGAFSTP